jgi:protein ImuB
VVYAFPVPAEVVAADGSGVRVSGRGLCTNVPARLSMNGSPEVGVVAWAGPWPVDERWWDPAAHRRRARFQFLTANGVAHLASVEGGRWWIEATYD